MTKAEAFNKKKPQLLKAMEKAILKSAKECPEGFLSFLGMRITPTAVKQIRNM